MDINKTINDLWPDAPEWANYIAVDFDGQVWGYEYYPNTDNKHKSWMPNHGYNCSSCKKLTDFDHQFPNWKELIFERPKIKNMDINETINDLWSIAPEWVNFITIDFDGEVWGYKHHPNVQYKTEEWQPVEKNGSCKYEKLTDFYREFPNWAELVFERPLSLPTTENQLTPLLQKFRNYLDITPRRQIEADWAQVKSLGLTGSPNCEEFIKTFKS